jgi:hypothetical protein
MLGLGKNGVETWNCRATLAVLRIWSPKAREVGLTL